MYVCCVCVRVSVSHFEKCQNCQKVLGKENDDYFFSFSSMINTLSSGSNVLSAQHVCVCLVSVFVWVGG